MYISSSFSFSFLFSCCGSWLIDLYLRVGALHLCEFSTEVSFLISSSLPPISLINWLYSHYSIPVPSHPLMFMLKTVDNSSTMLFSSWSPPELLNGILLGYIVSCTSSKSEELYFNVSPDFTTHLLANLSTFTSYSCAVSARTAAGEGPLSNSSDARTGEDGKGRVHFWTFNRLVKKWVVVVEDC